jgi:hypothetical protein
MTLDGVDCVLEAFRKRIVANIHTYLLHKSSIVINSAKDVSFDDIYTTVHYTMNSKFPYSTCSMK